MTTPPCYSSGDEIRVGDQVDHPGPATGVVVFVLERGEFAPGFPAEEWSYLESGFMVQDPDGTLIFYPEPDACITLRARSRPAGT